MSRPLVYGCLVKSADGVLYQVGYVGPHDAELRPLLEDGARLGESINLPLGELRRVADPTKKKPPIEDLPVDRPLCAWCQKKLAPVTREETNGKHGWQRRFTRRVFVRWSSYRGLFCTLTCALAFAEASHRAGYRRKLR